MLPILSLLGLALGAAFLVPVGHDRPAEGEDDPYSDPRHGPDGEGGTTADVGQAGDDRGLHVSLGDGADAYQGGDGADLIRGRGGDDWLDGAGGDDRLIGGAGSDDLEGETGDDSLTGGGGDDVLSGHGDDDALGGGGGNDALQGGEGNDALDGGAGDDALSGNAGDDDLHGGAGEDVLNGGDGDDRLESTGDGRDYLNGQEGDDRLTGGARDNLDGGEGADTFALGDSAATGDAAPVIDDFEPGRDVIEVAYDPAQGPPTLTCGVDHDGATLFADGAAVARLPGAAEIDLSAVRLVPAA